MSDPPWFASRPRSPILKREICPSRGRLLRPQPPRRGKLAGLRERCDAGKRFSHSPYPARASRASPVPTHGWQVTGSPRSLRKSGGFLFALSGVGDGSQPCSRSSLCKDPAPRGDRILLANTDNRRSAGSRLLSPPRDMLRVRQDNRHALETLADARPESPSIPSLGTSRCVASGAGTENRRSE